MKVNPYLSFPGTCEEALNFYKEILGGELGETMLYDDSPMASDEAKGKILHTSLTYGDGNMLMASDDVDQPLAEGNNISLAIGLCDEAEAERVFNALSDGGTITMPYQKTFWAKGFGMFKDKYGINWMVDCD